jgi:hypothetical protein
MSDGLLSNPRVYADFHNADTRGRLRLNYVGTVEDLARHQVVLRDGLLLTLYSEELEVEGQVQYSTDENLWVAVIDWDAIREETSVPGADQPMPQRKTA